MKKIIHWFINKINIKSTYRAYILNKLYTNFDFVKGVSIRKNVTFYNNGILKIGKNSFINEECFIDTHGDIEIGNNVIISYRCVIISGTHSISEKRCGKGKKKKVTIKNNVWIGANSTIYPGITIESGSVISAGAVVDRDVPLNVIFKNGEFLPIILKEAK
jgi:acetyltransferase-like isoleucine patch superfamily enzyme